MTRAIDLLIKFWAKLDHAQGHQKCYFRCGQNHGKSTCQNYMKLQVGGWTGGCGYWTGAMGVDEAVDDQARVQDVLGFTYLHIQLTI